ncbi:MAG: ABC transporter ATP-binding protein [Anaerolineaceae bacterium]
MQATIPATSGAGAKPARTRTDMSALGRAIRYLGQHKKTAAFAYGALLISTVAQLMVPQIIQNIMDTLSNGMIAHELAKVPATILPMALEKLNWTMDQFNQYSNNWLNLLLGAGALVVLFAVLRGLFSYIQTYMNERVGQSIAFDMRNDLFAKIQRLSFSYHDKNQTGQLMVRATDDVEKVRLFLAQGLLMAVQAVVLLVAAIIVLFFTNAKLTLVVLPILPLVFVLMMILGRQMQPIFTEVQIRLSAINTTLQENLAGIKVIKAFVREPEQRARFNGQADHLMDQQIKVSRFFSIMMPSMFLIATLGQVAVQYFGGRQIIMGTLTLGEWQKFSMYLMFVLFPMGMLGMIINMMSQAGASAKRIFEILDARSDVSNKADAIEMPIVNGHVEFDHVTFRYFGGGEPALDNVTFSAQPGQTVALLGATGSGKSSIINLIPRFYDATSGSVRIDGHDVRDVTLESLRSQIGIVLQDTTLFTGTIRDNIAFGRPDASMEEVTAAAKAAEAHDFIMSFPQGYDTPVGERGTTLSGGQKQRIAIARALLLDPRILILDDSTSSVDTVTEYDIQQTLTHLMQGRTSFVIAQRISTVRNADQILVLDKGKLMAQGKHDDLMEDSAIYAEIYNSQLVEDASKQSDVEGVPAEEVSHE